MPEPSLPTCGLTLKQALTEHGLPLAATFGEEGRAAYHTLSNNNPDYEPKETDYQYIQCLKHTSHITAHRV